MSLLEPCDPTIATSPNRKANAKCESSPNHGQATVEFALLLPIAIGCLLLVVQVLIVVLGHITLHHEARVAVRAAAVAPDPVVAARTALEQRDAQTSSRLDVQVTEQMVTVRLSRTVPIAIPFLGGLWPDITMTANLTMALEPPLYTMALN